MAIACENYDVMFAEPSFCILEDAQCGLSSSKEANVNDDIVFVPSSAFSPCLAVLCSLSAAHLWR